MGNATSWLGRDIASVADSLAGKTVPFSNANEGIGRLELHRYNTLEPLGSKIDLLTESQEPRGLQSGGSDISKNVSQQHAEEQLATEEPQSIVEQPSKQEEQPMDEQSKEGQQSISLSTGE